jgi:hypothetical protein
VPSPKFILADQSISSIAGHHYEYAVHVLEAAQRAGYQPVLAAHERFSRDAAARLVPWKTLPVYRYGFWAAQGPVRFALLEWVRGALARGRFRARVAFTFSPLGLAWGVRTRFSEFLFRQPIDKPHLFGLVTLIPAVLLLKLLRLLALLIALPGALAVFLFRSARRLLAAGGFPQTYARSLLADAADFLRLNQLLFERRVSMLSWWQQFRCVRSFARDTHRLFEEVAPAAGDIIYLPTVSAIELMGLTVFLARYPAARDVSWRLMFRRDIYRGREKEYGAQESRLNDLRQVFQNCAGKLAGARVAFFTDTDELTAQYNWLGAFRFSTGPIPHTHVPADRSARIGPLRAIYIGDARREKGFHYLPRLIQDLWDDYVAPGKVSFHFQANYNVPQGEPEAVIARTRMEAWPPDKVQLLKEPLTSEQYRRFLLDADINLLLYDTTNYYARSSGILVESLTAGVPVIVPAGSWLARQFLVPYYRYQESLRDRLQPLRAYTAGQLRWQVHGNPKLSAYAGGVITATRGAKAFTFVRVPPGATHLLAGIGFAPGTVDAELVVDQMDLRGHSLEPVYPRLIEGAGADCRGLALIRLNPRASKLWVAFGSLYAQAGIAIRECRLEFLAVPAGQAAPPTGAIGLIYHDLEEAPRLLAEMIDHHAHYSAGAREFAGQWRAWHNADRLVEMLP